MKIPCDDNNINISEEMNRSGVWKSLEGSSTNLNEKHEMRSAEKRKSSKLYQMFFANVFCHRLNLSHPFSPSLSLPPPPPTA